MRNEMLTRGAEMPGTHPKVGGRNLPRVGSGASSITAKQENTCHVTEHTMETVVEEQNMQRAYKRVMGNKGSAGIDTMPVESLKPYLQKHWLVIKEELLDGRYTPQPVLRVEIPKPQGGKRLLGIPTVVDRLIQQALQQVLVEVFDPGFSDYSYGFRPRCSAHQAVLQAREYMASGKRWVVDLDIEKFFDRVNHDILMSRVARKIKDKRLLRLIRRYLQSGVMEGGVVSPTREGTPQGGPLSPLLSNVLLDELDKELERRGHSFCRYADDCNNIYVQSRRAGERVMASIARFLEKRLRLKLNEEKSTVSRPWNTSYLGYTVTSEKQPRLKPAPNSVKRLKQKLRMKFRQGRGRNLQKVIEDMNPQLRGWCNYFGHSETTRVFEELDWWIRRRYRCMIWRQWKKPRTRMKKLITCGLDEGCASRSAYNGRGPWWNSGATHMNQALRTSYFDTYGLFTLANHMIVLHSKS